MDDLALAMTSLEIVDDPLADWDWAFFPLLFLPVEILIKIISYLPLYDRLRARVCRKLLEVQSKNRYLIEDLIISTPGWILEIDSCFRLTLTNSQNGCLNQLKGIASICRITNIYLNLNNQYQEVFEYAFQIATDYITIHSEDLALNEVLLTLEAVERIVAVTGRQAVAFHTKVAALTAPFLQTLYHEMESGIKPLTMVKFVYDVAPAPARSFLAGLGLRDDSEERFTSTNPAMKIYYCRVGEYVIKIHNMRIFVDVKIYEEGLPGLLYIDNGDRYEDMSDAFWGMPKMEYLADDGNELPLMAVNYVDAFNEEGNEEN